MALQIHSPIPSSFTNKPYLLLSPIRTKTNFTVKSQDPSPSQKPTVYSEPSNEPSPPNKPKPNSPALGFGSSSSSPGKSNVSPVSSRKKQNSKRKRASIVRRSPVENPASFLSQEDGAEAKEQSKNESAFLLTWLGLGGLILVEGILLSASGFLPDEWDKFFVKYLYPSFTPTVVLFIAGTVAYGVLKYLQNEKLTDQK